jgi:hypothetical protein
MLLLGHAGHTLLTILNFAPVVAFLAWLALTVVRRRLSERNQG